MELTQSDYEERVARVAAGQGSDEDRRLLKLYGREGFEPERLSDLVTDEDEDDSTGDDSTGDDSTGDDSTGDDYDTLDYRAVQTLARERSIDATGKQAEIVARLRAADAAGTQEG